MCECKLFYFGALVLCNVIFVTSFNVDTFNYAVFGQNTPSMFGFTVAMHVDSRNRPWVLVGAPEAQSIYQDYREVYRGGAVFKCRPTADDQCEEIQFNRPKNKRLGENLVIDDQSLQWFGATLSATGRTNGPVVACAPRYIWFTKDRKRRDPVGTCFVSNGALDSYEEYSPCRTMNWGYHRQGSCQAGFSAAINREGDRLYVGAPGSYYWQGQMYSIDAHATFNYTPSYFGLVGFGAKGSVYQQKLEDRPAVFSTREGNPPDDDSYLGYSLVVGDFREHDPFEGIAVGMPRGNRLRGTVLLFTWNLRNYKNITANRQIGAYFGYSITAADVNGDKRLDLIVGAPMHAPTPNNDKKYDVGRIYVCYQTVDETTSFNEPDVIDGINSKSRFGHALSSLGDINQDGFDDVAVGAPYDGPNGRGAVYIFYGSERGLRHEYGQVIYAEDIQSRIPVKTFGFSVSGGVDLDGNDYPDMAVGAYLSDTAIFFRSRPTVVVDAQVNFLTRKKQIDITKGNCTLDGRPGEKYVCTAINFCIKYSGKGIPQQMYMSLEYILDGKKRNNPRMFFKGRNTNTFKRTILLYKHQEQCDTKDVYISDKIRDKLTPLEAQVNYLLMEESSGDLLRNPRSQLKPVLDLNSPPSRNDSIIIQKDCGEDGICIPDLHVNVTSDFKNHYLGSDVDLGFDIVISNYGEDAFETKFEMKYPEGIEFIKHEIAPYMSGILCDPPSNNTIICDIGNPLPKQKIAKFRSLFQPLVVPVGGEVAPSYNFYVKVNSTNPEESETMANNYKNVSVDIWVDASLELRGDSYPSTVYYNESHYSSKAIFKESDIGPQITHVYYLRNGGPSIIEEAEVYILWPFKTLGDEDLLYILEEPQSKGNVKCQAEQLYDNSLKPFNYKKYDLEVHREDIWNRLKIDTSKVEFQATASASSGAPNIEVGRGVSSGVGVVNVNTNETRYEKTGSYGTTHVHKTSTSSGTSSRGKMYVDQQGNVESSFEEKSYQGGSNAGTNRFSGSGRQVQGETEQQYDQYGGRQSAAGQQGSRQFTGQDGRQYQGGRYNQQGQQTTFVGQGGTQRQDGGQQFSTGQTTRYRGGQQGVDDRRQQTYTGQYDSSGDGQYGHHQFTSRNETYFQGNQQQNVGAGARGSAASGGTFTNYDQRGRPVEGGSQRQGGQQQYSTSQTTRHGGGQQDVDDRRQETYNEQYGSSGVDQRQYHQHFSTHNGTYFQGHHQQGAGMGEGGGGESRTYYEQRGSPEEGEVVYRKTYVSESSTVIPIELEGVGTANRQSLGDFAGGQGFRFQITGLDNKPPEFVTVANGGAYDSASSASGHGQAYNKSGSSFHSSGGYNQSGGTFSGSSAGYGQGYDQDGGSSTYWHSEGTYSQSRGQVQPPFVHNSIEQRDNVPTDRPMNPRHRGRRQTGDLLQEIQTSEKCSAAKCSYIKCTVGTVNKDKEVAILLRSRLNVRALRNITESQSIKLSSMMVAKITKLPYIGAPTERIIRKHEIFTEVPAKETELVPEVAPLWLYVVSAVAGVVMLLLLIWLLSKCGFFKRHRPSSAPERQPLNRNGYQSGDEAL